MKEFCITIYMGDEMVSEKIEGESRGHLLQEYKRVMENEKAIIVGGHLIATDSLYRITITEVAGSHLKAVKNE